MHNLYRFFAFQHGVHSDYKVSASLNLLEDYVTYP